MLKIVLTVLNSNVTRVKKKDIKISALLTLLQENGIICRTGSSPCHVHLCLMTIGTSSIIIMIVVGVSVSVSFLTYW